MSRDFLLSFLLEEGECRELVVSLVVEEAVSEVVTELREVAWMDGGFEEVRDTRLSLPL